MTFHEDSDIKIFKPEEKADQDSAVLAIVEKMNYHRQNGNVDKAKKLGSDIAMNAFDATRKEKFVDETFLVPDIIPQVCALILFSAEAALNYYLPFQQLSAIAINTLHETLISNNAPFYEPAINSTAFSFYYLSVRKGGTDIPKDIGEAFAMLCRREEDELFVNQGKQLYTLVLKTIEQMILDAKFSK
ncbi:MAG: hypothetical protein GX241_01930 [Ruminococcaceae bacterium]|nr:hypothetical protein [Oscillospiraceae bacterium]